MTKFKSRLKDRPFTVGSTGEGFPEFLGAPTESFPHGVQVNNPHQSSLAELTAQCMEYVKENHAQHPAILFRNLPAQTAQDFSTIAKAIPWKPLTNEGGAAYRQQIDKSVGTYTANDDPGDITIDPHNEMSFTKVYPSKVNFDTNVESEKTNTRSEGTKYKAGIIRTDVIFCCREPGTKKKSEPSTGIESTTIGTPVGSSNH